MLRQNENDKYKFFDEKQKKCHKSTWKHKLAFSLLWTCSTDPWCRWKKYRSKEMVSGTSTENDCIKEGNFILVFTLYNSWLLMSIFCTVLHVTVISSIIYASISQWKFWSHWNFISLYFMLQRLHTLTFYIRNDPH